MTVAICSGCKANIDLADLFEDASSFTDGFYSGPAGECPNCGMLITTWDLILSRDVIQRLERERGERSLAGSDELQIGSEAEYEMESEDRGPSGGDNYGSDS